MARDQTAALIVIGNEILSGKVVDTNSAFLARELRALGVTLRRMVVIPDEIDDIADEVRAMQPRSTSSSPPAASVRRTTT